jgi:methionyl aminopeptidase
MSHNGNEYCVLLFDEEAADRMRKAARIARKALRVACDHAQPGVTTDQIDAIVHDYIIAQNGYPSPLNYAGFPKSLCSSINEIICHGIPDMRPLEFGDVVSFDVSCFYDGVHGDNCATMIVGDQSDDDMENPLDCWRGIPIRTEFATDACRVHFEKARRLVRAAYETLNNAIAVVRPGGCLSDIGAACQETVDKYGYQSVTKYRGHGISSDFHIPPFVKHYQNDEVLRLEPGMIFTIEPMITEFSNECFEWESDGWTVSTTDYGLAAQFEHTVLVTETGVEILTVDDDKDAFPRQAAN